MAEHANIYALAGKLGYTDTDGLAFAGQQTASGTRSQLLKRATDNVRVDAVYFAGDRPLVYFAQRASLDPETRWRLHRAAWNDSRVPLLFIVAKDEVAIFDSYAEPGHTPEHVNSEGRLITALNLLSSELATFARPEVESGQLWRRLPNHFDPKRRCDQTLLENLRITQDELHDQGLPHPVIYKLLPRVILIMYLDHRRVLTSSYYNQFGSAQNLFEALRKKRTAYQLFAALQKKFNGDLFPVSPDESQVVTDHHVATVAEFLSGTTMISGQRSLWPLYDFSIIPIQLVSAIYEFFLRDRRRPDKAGVGTVYTPQELVELLMNEVLPWPTDGKAEHRANGALPRVMDPACGSGIFLVEAYRRIVERWRVSHPDQRPGAKELRAILTNSIFGIEQEASARHVTAFSLYLALLDYLKPKYIWTHVRFPTLTESENGRTENLRLGDAFASGDGEGYDLVVGNPPWKRNYVPESARRYCAERDQPIASELAHPFMWRSLDLMRQDGRAAVLAPAKWLFNLEGPDEDFRRAFFERAYVESIVNLSAVRRELFADAVGPATAVVFRRTRPTPSSDAVLYCTPKPQRDAVFPLLIDGDDIKWIPRRDAEARDDVWKPLMWATWRDLLLARRMREHGETVEDFLAEHGYVTGHGFQPFRQGRNRPKRAIKVVRAPDLAELPHIEAKHITRNAIDPKLLRPRFDVSTFAWIGPREIYDAPHVLLKESVPQGRLAAAFTNRRCTFRNTVTGISGPDADLLKALTLYINSRLASYFVFLTSTTWGVERERATTSDVLRLPAKPLNDAKYARSLASLYDRWVAKASERDRIEQETEAVIGDLFGLTDLDRVLIDDLTAYVLPSDDAIRTDPITADDLNAYVRAFALIMNSLIGNARGMLATLRPSDGPLSVVSMRLTEGRGVDLRVAGNDDLNAVLRRLDEQLTSRESASVHVRRHVRYYEGETLHIVKPAERQYWTRSAAFADADETVAQSVARKVLVPR